MKKSEQKAFDAELAKVRERQDLYRRRAETVEGLGGDGRLDRQIEAKLADDVKAMQAWHGRQQ